jgi:hypothetical protein
MGNADTHLHFTQLDRTDVCTMNRRLVGKILLGEAEPLSMAANSRSEQFRDSGHACVACPAVDELATDDIYTEDRLQTIQRMNFHEQGDRP